VAAPSPHQRPRVAERHAETLSVLALLFICLLALGLRLYGADWDQGYFFHPDERQVFYVTEELQLPSPLTWQALLDPESSWNPDFFAYGSLPMYLLRIVADLLKHASPAYDVRYAYYLVARGLSALFDTVTVMLVYALAKRLYGRGVALLGALFTALAVLHIQLSHFYTVDTLLTFFALAVLMAAVRLAQEGGVWSALPIGVALGAAIATKVSAAPLLGIVALSWLLAARRAEGPLEPRAAWGAILLSAVVAALVFVLSMPYALIDFEDFYIGVARESLMVQGGVDWPYTRQYIGTLPYVYLAWQTTKWALGFPLGVAGFAGALWACWAQLRRLVVLRLRALDAELLPVVWFVVYFGLVGAFHTKFLRYMLPVLPLLCMWAARLCLRLWQARAVGGVRWGRAILPLVASGAAFYAGAFMNIYRHEHTWIRATQWICANYAPSRAIMVETWDDPLPLLQGQGELRCTAGHVFQFFEAHDEDSKQKLEELLDLLTRSDYVSISSNRLYNALPRLNERFPLTSRYYELLFSGQLGFELVHYEDTQPSLWGLTLANDTFSNPDLPVPALIAQQQADLRINLGRADESFTVYDHPKPLIFQRTSTPSREELFALFADVVQSLPDTATDE